MTIFMQVIFSDPSPWPVTQTNKKALHLSSLLFIGNKRNKNNTIEDHFVQKEALNVRDACFWPFFWRERR